MRRDVAGWTAPGERWSLGGAQSKFALARDRQGRWFEATGAAATTHILKPGVEGFRSHGLNEHLTMQVAQHLGLRVAATSYQEFEGEPAVIATRYDRLVTEQGVIRIHQEDICQALSVARGKKYEEQGGPGASQIIDLLAAVATPADVWRFVESLAFNYLTGASDDHAKNYSLLLAGTQTRLAPLYDLSSSLPYDTTGPDPGLRSLAMAIGGERRFGEVTAANFDRLARRAGIPPERLRSRVEQLATDLPDALATAITNTPSSDNELGRRYLDRLVVYLRRVGYGA